MSFHKLNTPVWPLPRWRNRTLTSQKFLLIFPCSQSWPLLSETSYLTSYCIRSYCPCCILCKWEHPEARHNMIIRFIHIIECGCWSFSWLCNVLSYECITRFVFFWDCHIWCEVKPQSKPERVIMGFEQVWWQWGWRSGHIRDLWVRIIGHGVNLLRGWGIQKWQG